VDDEDTLTDGTALSDTMLDHVEVLVPANALVVESDSLADADGVPNDALPLVVGAPDDEGVGFRVLVLADGCPVVGADALPKGAALLDTMLADT
jgi:hypothetical protein